MATIEPRGEGKWIIRVSNGTAPGGKRIRPSMAFEGTEKQAKKAAEKFEIEVKEGRYFPEGNKVTLAQFITDYWRPDYAEMHLAQKTYHRYNQMIEQRILPQLGQMKLSKIKPVVINRFIRELSEAPRMDGKPGTLSAQTLKHHFACLSAILQKAVEWDVIKDNPCLRVKPPRVPRAKVKVFNEEETRQFIYALETQASLKYRAMCWLEIDTGLREGEMMGLEWQDIDFEAATIKIERVSQYLPGVGTYTKDNPKTEASARLIAISPNVMELLAEYKAEWEKNKQKVGDLWQGTKRVFCTWDGKPHYTQRPYKWLKEFLERNNLPHCSFHSLRHLSVTLMIKANVPLKQISGRVGHTRVGTTADIYAEMLASVDREAANLVGQYLEKAKAEAQQSSDQLVATFEKSTDPKVIELGKYKSKKARKEGIL